MIKPVCSARFSLLATAVSILPMAAISEGLIEQVDQFQLTKMVHELGATAAFDYAFEMGAVSYTHLTLPTTPYV